MSVELVALHWQQSRLCGVRRAALSSSLFASSRVGCAACPLGATDLGAMLGADAADRLDAVLRVPPPCPHRASHLEGVECGVWGVGFGVVCVCGGGGGGGGGSPEV